MRFERTVWECPRCRASQAPLDAELGLEPGEKMCRGLVRKVAWSAAQNAFADAAANVREMTGLAVSPAECQRVALAQGARIEALQRREEARRNAPASPESPAAPPELAAERLVVLADATAVLTRAGEDHKMVWCGRAFALEDRAAKQGADGQAVRPFIGCSRHAGGAGDLEDFGPRLKALAWRMGLRTAKATAFVADGAPCLWKWAAEHLPAGTVLIQDFWHVIEHLAAVARELDAAAAGPRLERWTAALRESRIGEVLEELRGEHKRRRGALRARLEKEIAYLEHGRARMDYAAFQAAGWPIGSGAIEADCKHLVKERFGLTGARWLRSSIGPVLALRQALFNEEWDAAWTRN